MRWRQYRIQTSTEAEDLAVMMLTDLGIQGVMIEDNLPLTSQDMAQMFIDIPPEPKEDRGEAFLSFYLELAEAGEGREEGLVLPGVEAENGADGGIRSEEELLKAIRDGFSQLAGYGVNVGPVDIQVSESQDTDWQNNWKAFFHSFYIEDMLIHPSWEPEENEKGGVTISIDPGISFGTGQHETTQLCIRALRKHVKAGDALLDLGCGSGILSIVGHKLGAASISGTDIDPDCIVSVSENFARNDVPFVEADYPVGNLITDPAIQKQFQTGSYDLVCANILADVIIPMAEKIPACLKEGGIFIASGIIDSKEEAVAEAIRAAGLTILSVDHQGEWVGLTAQK